MPNRHLFNSSQTETPDAGSRRSERRGASIVSARTRSQGTSVFARLLLSALLATLAGCSAGGGGSSAATGGSGSGGVGGVVAVDPVHLAPGQTAAQLAWPASEGAVDNYFVFESRNGSPYAFSTISDTPSVDIVGAPGDSVQITVVAVSENGQMSESSPPSPPMIFHAPAAAVEQVAAAGGVAPTAVSPANETMGADTNASDSNEASLADASDDTPNAATNDDDETTSLSRLTQTLRDMLLGGDARLPEAGLSSEAAQWLQAQVDIELSAGVALAGTGRSDDDALRELVWQDNAGQLFVSNGQLAIDATDLPATFDEALRLRATERFAGLADLNGDGVGDWLVEDTATGDVWVIDGADESNASAVTAENADALLAGHGDFDGDGQAELVWTADDGTLDISRADANAPELLDRITAPDGFELLAIGDFDGNGRDDLLGRNADGGLVMALANPDDELGDDTPLALSWQEGTASPSADLDLIATLDVDDDGTAEIAWLDGDTLEIWNAYAGLESRLAL